MEKGRKNCANRATRQALFSDSRSFPPRIPLTLAGQVSLHLVSHCLGENGRRLDLRSADRKKDFHPVYHSTLFFIREDKGKCNARFFSNDFSRASNNFFFLYPIHYSLINSLIIILLISKLTKRIDK